MQIKKYIGIFLMILLVIPTTLKIQELHQSIETQNIEMDRYIEAQENSPLFGVIEIPSISLKQPIYPKNHSDNQVDKNVTLLEETISEREDNFLLVLASHSGSGIHSYFKNLSLIQEGEEIKFYYNNQIYTYEFFKKEEVLKIGSILIDSYTFPSLILITCSKTKDNIQEVYYAKLISIS